MFSFVLIALIEGRGSSYMASVCVLLSIPLDCCSFSFLALFLRTMTTMAVVKTTTLAIKATAKEVVVIKYTIDLPVFMVMYCASAVCMVIVLLVLPTRLPHNTACIANVHTLLLVGTLVQVTLVWLVVVGQLPQFDARML